jgi:hypothetical protein
MKEVSEVINCSETIGALSEEGTALFVTAIGMVGIVAQVSNMRKKGLLSLGEIGYILVLYISCKIACYVNILCAKSDVWRCQSRTSFGRVYK